MKPVVLDTSVVIEYANAHGKFHPQATALFASLETGRLQALVPAPILSEVYYVARRVYAAVGAPEPRRKAQQLCEYVYYHPAVEVAELTLPTLLAAGRAKDAYGLALADCFVLAVAKTRAAQAVFRHREHELAQRWRRVRRAFRVLFLEDYG